MNLSPVERIQLADTLYGSVEKASDRNLDQVWKKEIDRRLDDYDEGKATVLTAQETHSRVRKAIVEARRLSAPGRR